MAYIRQILDSGVKDKPVTISFVGGEKSEKAMRWLVDHGIPAYGAPDLAVNAMASLREYAKMKELLAEKATPIISKGKAEAMKIIAAARSDGRDALTEIEAKQVFAFYGLPVTATELAKSEDDAIKLAKKIGFPVVMKSSHLTSCINPMRVV